METLLAVKTFVYYLDKDMASSDHLLFSTDYGLYRAKISSRLRPSLIAGDERRNGYREGKGINHVKTLSRDSVQSSHFQGLGAELSFPGARRRALNSGGSAQSSQFQGLSAELPVPEVQRRALNSRGSAQSSQFQGLSAELSVPEAQRRALNSRGSAHEIYMQLSYTI